MSVNHRLDELIMQSFAKAPTEPCLWWRGAWWSRGAVEEMIIDCEESLKESGFSKGQRIVLFLQNSPIFLACCIAVWRLGGAVVPVNPQLKSPSLQEYLRQVDAFGAVVSGETEGLEGVLLDAGVPAVSVELGDALPLFAGRKDARPDEDSEMAVLFHTAGVSGAAKAVPITHANIVALLSSILELVPSIDEDDVILNALPNYHSFGFVIGGALPLAFGMPQVVVPSFVPPKTTLAAIRAANVTIVPAIPLMLSVLIGSERDTTPLSKVRLVFAGGGKISPALAERTREIFGVDVLEGYGLTEASSVLAVTPGKNAMRAGTCGRILSTFEAEVCDQDGNALPFDAEGRLWIRGDAVAAGYYRAPELSAERFKDGWFDTQDVVRIAEDGYITIVSRAVDVILVGGMPVYPTEVENVLLQHPAIAQAAAVGLPRGIKGEMVKVFVVLKEGATVQPRELISFCRSRLPNYKVPRLVKIVPGLPKDEQGKVLKKELRGVQ